MKSRRNPRFRKLFAQLPADVQQLARDAYLIFHENPQHPSLQFKPVGPSIYSARVGAHYRAVGVLTGNTIVWTWIGSHEAYNRHVKTFRKG